MRIQILLAGLLSAPLAAAHHSVAAEFAEDQGVLAGRISQVWYVNPHIRYRLTVDTDSGPQDWELQAGNITSLRRADWFEDTLQVGDSISVSGRLGRDGARKLLIGEVTLADGSRIVPRASGGRADRNRIRASAQTSYGYDTTVANRPFDLTGAWRSDYRWQVTVDDLEPKPTPFTEKGAARFAATESWHDYALRCIDVGLPRLFGAPYNMDIVDAGSHYVFLYIEQNSVRRIWMDGRSAPANTPATSNGYSVGRWEGQTLIVETTHLLPAWLDGSGLPMNGEGTRIVERYVPIEDGLALDRTMTIYDANYTEPMVRQRYSARDDNVDLTAQASCDPNSFFRDLDAQGRLQEHFER